jgi:hypothetical protein
MITVTPLTNYGQFVELTNMFDSANNTTTYIAKMSLLTVNQTFLQRDMHDALNREVARTFNKTSVVLSNDTTIIVDDRKILYTCYHIVKDINNGIGILHPISIHYFDKNAGMHPGNTRLHFMYQYHNEIDIIITDYTGNLLIDNNQIKFNSVANSFFNIDELSFLTNVADKTGPRSIYNASCRVTPYKECIHTSTANAWGLTGYPTPVLQYELKNNAVYVNGDKILYSQDDKWWLNI